MAIYVTKVEDLGSIIQPNQVNMDPVKMNGIEEWPTPKTVKEVQSFLGFTEFYRRFIVGYAGIVRALNDLTKKDKPWAWTNDCQKAFDVLKEKFKGELVLSMSEPTKPFKLATNASLVATGGVLAQRDKFGKLKPCGFISKSLSATERNYQIYD